MHNRNIELGLVEQGQRKSEVVSAINEAFEDLTNLMNHVRILDIAAAFELHFRARLRTAIGEARRVLREHYSIAPLADDRERLAIAVEDIQGLAEIASLIGGRLSNETSQTLSQIRADRNKFAHGTDIRVPPATTSEQARDVLNEIITSV